MTKTQRRVVEMLQQGCRLWWHGDMGPEMDDAPWVDGMPTIEGIPCWPQKRTVRALIRDGVLRWMEYKNEVQKQAGTRELELNPERTSK